ncbi:MAG: hypothetical protein R3D55_01810 [Chloroflexota bacterium]
MHYILAERFDEDPFLLFWLRGKTQDAVLASLGSGLAVKKRRFPHTNPPHPYLNP